MLTFSNYGTKIEINKIFVTTESRLETHPLSPCVHSLFSLWREQG